MELKNKTINFLGDSITEGCGTSCKEAVFHSIIKEKYGLKEVRNYGEGGTRIARQSEVKNIARDRDFILRTWEMNPDADVVVVFGGTNDFGNGQAPLGKFTDRGMYTFYGAVHFLIRALIEKYLGKQIVFMTPLHRWNENGEGAWKPDGVKQMKLKDYAHAIKEVCEYYSVPVLDLFAEGELRGNTAEWYKQLMPDGVHPNDEGHKIIANKLGKFLENL